MGDQPQYSDNNQVDRHNIIQAPCFGFKINIPAIKAVTGPK
jgi:hypothetical protein